MLISIRELSKQLENFITGFDQSKLFDSQFLIGKVSKSRATQFREDRPTDLSVVVLDH